jgi:DNA integrity scanning protein DisA with diadenylate cyclase activity
MISDFLKQLEEVVRHLGWGEVIDVAFVAFVLYYLLRLLRGTQGTQILVGLVLLAVVGVVATQFNLVLISWLFKNAGFFILIAVIVMFQPELRRGLEQIGRGRLFVRDRRAEDEGEAAKDQFVWRARLHSFNPRSLAKERPRSCSTGSHIATFLNSPCFVSFGFGILSNKYFVTE